MKLELKKTSGNLTQILQTNTKRKNLETVNKVVDGLRTAFQSDAARKHEQHRASTQTQARKSTHSYTDCGRRLHTTSTEIGHGHNGSCYSTAGTQHNTNPHTRFKNSLQD